MTPLLEHPLVLKYFDDGQCGEHSGMKCWTGGTPKHLGCMALRIFMAMQQPIRKGERYLHLSYDGTVDENINEYEDVSQVLHVSSLRLPDKFQAAAEPDPVEERIEGLVEFFGVEGASYTNEAIRKMFRELVELARAGK